MRRHISSIFQQALKLTQNNSPTYAHCINISPAICVKITTCSVKLREN